VFFAAVKNFANPPRIDKVIAMVRLSPFLTHGVDRHVIFKLDGGLNT